MLKITNLSKLIEAAHNHARAIVDRVIDYQKSEGYECIKSEVFVRAILQADDVGEYKHLYIYTYLQKQFGNRDKGLLDLNKVLIQEVYLSPDGSFEFEEHAYSHPLDDEELEKSVWRSRDEETPFWVRNIELQN
jgi:hypothetical protein